MSAALRRLLPLLIGGGARLIAAVIGLLATTVAARALGPESWGTWTLLFAAFGWTQHVAEWGLRSAALVDGGRRGRISGDLLRDLAKARALALAVAGAAWLTGVRLWHPELGGASLWLFFCLLAIALNLDWAALVRGSPLLPGATLIARPSLSLLVLVCLPGPLTAAGLAAATFTGFAGAAALGALELRQLRPDRSAGHARGAVRLLKAGTPFFLVTLANQVAASADLFAVALTLGAAAAGTFGLVVTIAQTATLGAQASAQWWLARAGLPDAPPLGRIVAESAVLGGLVAAALMAAGPPLVLLLFGAGWTQAAALLPLAGLFVGCAHLSAVLGAVVSARGGAGSVAALQLVTQASAWPAQLLTALQFGLAGVLLLRGLVELVRVVLLGILCLHRTRMMSISNLTIG